jgi:hypothetical protein
MRRLSYVETMSDQGRKCIVRGYGEDEDTSGEVRDQRAGQGGWLGKTSAMDNVCPAHVIA